MKFFSPKLAFTAALMVASTAVSSATVGEFTYDNGGGVNNVTTTSSGDNSRVRYHLIDSVGEGPTGLGISKNLAWEPEIVFGDSYSLTETSVGGSGDSLVTIAAALRNDSSIRFTGLDETRINNGFSLSYSEASAVQVPLPSAVWLFGCALGAFVVLSNRHQV